jgi:hypothetical protein
VDRRTLLKFGALYASLGLSFSSRSQNGTYMNATEDQSIDIAQQIEHFNSLMKRINPSTFEYSALKLEGRATDEQLVQLQKNSSPAIPEGLKNFYKKWGGIVRHVHSETYLNIPSVTTMLDILNGKFSSKWPGPTLKSLGLIDYIKYSWGNDRWEFESDEFFTTEQLHVLNEKYKCFGIYRPNLERAYYLYFDQQGNFGEILYDQNLFEETKNHLQSMLTKSPANQSFNALIRHAFKQVAIYRKA